MATLPLVTAKLDPRRTRLAAQYSTEAVRITEQLPARKWGGCRRRAEAGNKNCCAQSKRRIGSFAGLSAGRRWEKLPPAEAGNRAFCQRCQRGSILFFQKNPSPPSGSQVPSPCSQPGIDYVSLAKGARSPQPAGRAASRNVFDLPRRVQAEAIPGPPTAMRRPRPFGERG